MEMKQRSISERHAAAKAWLEGLVGEHGERFLSYVDFDGVDCHYRLPEGTASQIANRLVPPAS